MSVTSRTALSLLPGLLAEHALDGLLVVARSARDPDLEPFVGTAHLGASLLFVGRDGSVRLAAFSPMERDEARATGLEVVGPEALELGRAAREALRAEDFLAHAAAGLLRVAGLSPPGRLAVAGHAAAGTVHGALRALEAAGWSAVDGALLLAEARKRKGPAELAALRRAAAGTVAAFEATAALLAAATLDAHGAAWSGGERLRVGAVRAVVRRVLADHALEQPEGNLVACGGDAGVPHSQGDDAREIRAGVPLLVDLFPKGQMFADCTRVFCLGGVPPAVARAHATVREVLAAAWSAAVAGTRGWTLQEQACAAFHEAGYPTPLSDPGTTVGYVHGLGHGVGFELHEAPSFRKEAGREGVLAPGDVFTLEPGLYDPAPEGGYGVRLEDLVWLGDHGPENLTPLPYDLDPSAWRR